MKDNNKQIFYSVYGSQYCLEPHLGKFLGTLNFKALRVSLCLTSKCEATYSQHLKTILPSLLLIRKLVCNYCNRNTTWQCFCTNNISKTITLLPQYITVWYSTISDTTWSSLGSQIISSIFTHIGKQVRRLGISENCNLKYWIFINMAIF